MGRRATLMNAVPETQQPMKLSEPAREYARLQSRLHDLFVAGGGDSDDADAIRDAMDGPWHKMTEIERKLMRGLAEDLNSLLDNKLNIVPLSNTVSAEFKEKEEAARAKKQAGDPLSWLSLLRGEV